MASTDRRLVILAVCLVAAVAVVSVVAGLWPSRRPEDEALRSTSGERETGPAAEPAAIALQPAPAIDVQPRPEQPTSRPGVDKSGDLDAAGASKASIDPTGAMPTSIREEPVSASVPIAPELSPTGAPLDETRHGLPAEALDSSPTSVSWDDRHDVGAEPSPLGAGSSPTQEPDASPGSGG